jgi:membrane protease YdiL (CAAX protease family)
MSWANTQNALLLPGKLNCWISSTMKSYLSNYKDFVAGSSYWYKLLFVCFLVLLFFMLTGMLGLATIIVFGKHSLRDAAFLIDNPGPVDIFDLKLFQAIQTIGLFIGSAWVAAFFLSPKAGSYLKTINKPSVLSLSLVVLSMIAWIPAINYTAGLNARLSLPESMNAVENKIEALRNEYNNLADLFLNTRSVTQFITNIIVMAILPAIGEELLFRGVFQRLLTEWTRSIHWGVIIAALLFSFFHFEFYGFLPRFLLGVFFGYLFAWTSSIWVPILAHFTNNFIIVGYSFFHPPSTGPSPLEELGTHADMSLWISVAGGILLTVLLFYHEKSHRIAGK